MSTTLGNVLSLLLAGGCHGASLMPTKTPEMCPDFTLSGTRATAALRSRSPGGFRAI